MTPYHAVKARHVAALVAMKLLVLLALPEHNIVAAWLRAESSIGIGPNFRILYQPYASTHTHKLNFGAGKVHES